MGGDSWGALTFQWPYKACPESLYIPTGCSAFLALYLVCRTSCLFRCPVPSENTSDVSVRVSACAHGDGGIWITWPPRLSAVPGGYIAVFLYQPAVSAEITQCRENKPTHPTNQTGLRVPVSSLPFTGSGPSPQISHLPFRASRPIS